MKLYIVVRAALSAGLKCAQAVHAFRAFVGDHPVIEHHWHTEHNNVVVLEHDDPEALAGELAARELRLSVFREPDLDGQLTAICVEPAGGRWLSTLPLARA